MQSIPSIESVGDSNSDDEDEAIIFSGLHNSHQEVRVFNVLKRLWVKHSGQSAKF